VARLLARALAHLLEAVVDKVQLEVVLVEAGGIEADTPIFLKRS